MTRSRRMGRERPPRSFRLSMMTLSSVCRCLFVSARAVLEGRREPFSRSSTREAARTGRARSPFRLAPGTLCKQDPAEPRKAIAKQSCNVF